MAKQSEGNMSFISGHSLVTTHYGKYLITLSYADIPAESLSHSLHMSCQFPPLLANLSSPACFSHQIVLFSFLILFPGSFLFPVFPMSLGSYWRNSYANILLLDVSRTIPWRSTDQYLYEDSGAVFLITDKFHEQVSNLTYRNPALELKESCAQLGCEWCSTISGILTWMLYYVC